MHSCSICEIPQTHLLFETANWIVILNHDQNYLGRCVITAKRHVPSLSELSQDEWKDMQHMIQKTEKMLKGAFPFAVLNWGCMMNHAFKEKPFNPHVHWHVFPRHEKPISFDGQTWTDENFGKHYVLKASNKLPNENLLKILSHIQKFL